MTLNSGRRLRASLAETTGAFGFDDTDSSASQHGTCEYDSSLLLRRTSASWNQDTRKEADRSGV